MFLFGFSRGAYTARSIVGLIDNVGIPRRDQLRRVVEAYNNYRDKKQEWMPGGEKALEFKKSYCHEKDRIAFLGVWDTVGALMAEITDLYFHTKFHVVDFSESVENAFHAIAIDEKRWPFRPTHLRLNKIHPQRCADAKAKNPPPPYEGKWFPGVHSNVGGGYPDTGRSDCALDWMIDRATRLGMTVDLKRVDDPEFAPIPSATPEQSLSIWYRIPTIATVYLFNSLLKAIWPNETRRLDNLNWKGEYLRVIDDKENIGAALSAHPDDIGYAGAISPCAIEKLKTDSPPYRPRNIEL